MTGLERQRSTRAVLVETRELITKICEFAVVSSVNGHAQAAVVIRVDVPQGLPGHDTRPASTHLQANTSETQST
jgi:hypothetical protein